MLFYRVKPESNGKPYLVKKHGEVETWSAIVRGELFTPNEVARLGLNMSDLYAVEVNRRHTHYSGPYRFPDDDASITPVTLEHNSSNVKPLSKAVEEQVAKAAATRPTGKGNRMQRGVLKVLRA